MQSLRFFARPLAAICIVTLISLAACSQHGTRSIPPTANNVPTKGVSSSTTGCDSSISANFNGTSFGAGTTLWLTAVMKVSGVGSSPVTINMTQGSVAFTAGSAQYNLAVPNATVKVSPGSGSAAIISGSGGWSSTVPYPSNGNVLLDAVELPLTTSLAGGIQNVVWRGHFTSSQSGVSVQWAWSAAVYTQFSADYNALAVKPVDANSTSQYKNSDHAGTPENFRTYVTGGATGGGGSNYTGGLSGTESVAPCLVTWASKAPMSIPRQSFGLAGLNDELYAVGGYSNIFTGYDANFLTQVEAYDPAANTWTGKAPLNIKRSDLAVAVSGGKLYAIGGQNVNDGVLSSVEAYDPITDSWQIVASLPSGHRYSLAAGTVNGIIYAVGGRGIDPYDHVTNVVEAYDPNTNTWTTKAAMNHARSGLAVAVVNGILYAIGGWDGSALVNYVEEYNPTTDAWTDVSSMPTARYTLGAASVNSVVYAIGGYGGAPLDTSEAYDTSANAWSAAASMPTTRSELAVGELNGVIYAAGGTNSGDRTNDLATVEAFTP